MVVDKAFAAQLPAKLTPDSSAHIALISYKPNHLVYSFDLKNRPDGCFFLKFIMTKAGMLMWMAKDGLYSCELFVACNAIAFRKV